MNPIPVTFTYEGKEYKGKLSKVSGSGSISFYHLDVDGYHWGQLFYVSPHPGFPGDERHPPTPDSWRFGSNQPNMEHLADDFGRVVMAAMEDGW